MPAERRIESINAVTFHVSDMARSLSFYRSLLFDVAYGAADSDFASLRVGDQYLNLMRVPGVARYDRWGRVIIHVADVDAVYDRALSAGLSPEAPPRDAEWGERYFHLVDPDGHELSFARRL